MDTPEILLLIFGGVLLLLAALYVGASVFAFRLAFVKLLVQFVFFKKTTVIIFYCLAGYVNC
jgi:hypothetical protein